MKPFFIEDLSVGMEAEVERTVDEEHVHAFASLTGDHNPVHMSETFAAETVFKTRIAHGMLSAGFISAVLGTKMPGPGAIYLSQTLKFLAPVRIGDTVRTVIQVSGLDLARKRAQFLCWCEVAGKKVVEGEALIMVPSRATA